MWDLPRPGLGPMSPALAGGFLTTAPPGKSQPPSFYLELLLHTNTTMLCFSVAESSRLDRNLKPLHLSFFLCQEYFPSPCTWSAPPHHPFCLRVESPSFRTPPSPPVPAAAVVPTCTFLITLGLKVAVSSIRSWAPVSWVRCSPPPGPGT